MKAIILVCLSLLSLNAVAGRDGSPSETVARMAAFNHAKQLFGNEDLSVQLRAQNRSQFVFATVAQIDDETCYVDILVSKETGMAFNDELPHCE